MSLSFLQYHFGDRGAHDDIVLLLWDDFSGHWTPEVEAYAATLNVVMC